MEKNEATNTFTIAGCPLEVFDRFLRFCEGNSAVTKVFYKDGQREIKRELWYAGGLKMLLDIDEADSKNKMLFDRLEKLEQEIKNNGNTGSKSISDSGLK